MKQLLKNKKKHHAAQFLKKIFGVFVVVFLCPLIIAAQDIKATAELDTNSIRIGEQVKLYLRIQYNVDNSKQIIIRWPEIADTIRKEIEIVNQSKIDTLIPDKNNPFQFVQSKIIYLTSFDSGYWAIPPFQFRLEEDTSVFYTEPLLLSVGSIAVDTTLAIKDIKQPFDQSYNWLDWLKDNMYVVYGSLLAILLILLIIYLVRRFYKIKPAVVILEVPKIPAHIIAIQKLDELKNEKIWQQGKLKVYHIRLTEIVREYIENRYRIKALENTTDEILFGFRNVAIDEGSRLKLMKLLVLADLVKFAKEQPLPDENELSLSDAYDFVNGTKIELSINTPLPA